MSNAGKLPRPPYDPAMLPAVAQPAAKRPDIPAQEFVNRRRVEFAAMMGPAHAAFRADPRVRFEPRTAPGPLGDIPLEVFRSAEEVPAGRKRPGLVYIHGGAMYLGETMLGLDMDWITDLGAVVITVDYRLAPEHTGTALVDDCYAALLWIGANLSELGIDPERLMLGGGSAGGGLSAGTALMIRDRGGPKLCGLLLECPMLDDRNESVSCRQFVDSGTYTTTMNIFAWGLVLGEKGARDNVSPYVAPGRATDLSGLPETFIDVGSAEPFRDEAVAFASKLWECGSQAELHVWPGGFHGFGLWLPQVDISKISRAARNAWIKRRLERVIRKAE